MNTQKFITVLKETVRQLRWKWNKSQGEFAKLLGLCQSTIVKLEKGSYDKLPKQETLIAIARALNMPYWEFLKALEQGEEAIEEGEPISKHQITASVEQLRDFNDSFDVAQAALQRCQELRYLRDEESYSQPSDKPHPV